jgi:hypothetical protein
MNRRQPTGKFHRCKTNSRCQAFRRHLFARDPHPDAMRLESTQDVLIGRIERPQDSGLGKPTLRCLAGMPRAPAAEWLPAESPLAPAAATPNSSCDQTGAPTHRSRRATPANAAAAPAGALAGASNAGRVGETPIASDRLNVRDGHHQINTLGLNRALVSSTAPSPGHAPAPAGNCGEANLGASVVRPVRRRGRRAD